MLPLLLWLLLLLRVVLIPLILLLVLPAQDPALSTGIRHLIYNAVGMDYTYRSSLTLTIPLITWLLSETNWMDDEALKLCNYLIRLEQVNNQPRGIYIPVICWTAPRGERCVYLSSAAAPRRALGSCLDDGTMT